MSDALPEAAEPITSFEEIRHLLVELAGALQVLIAGYGPPWADGAPVLGDVRLDDELEGTPVLDGVLMVNVYLQHAKDHLLAAAKIADDPRVLMGCYTLARPILGSTSRAMWLLEPGLSSVERMRRGMNLQLKRLAELENIASDRDPALRKQLTASHIPAVERIERNAKSVKLQLTRCGPNRHGIHKPHYVGHELPSDMETQKILLDHDADLPTSDLVYRVASTFVHGEYHLIDLMGRQVDADPVAPGVAGVRLRVQLANLVAYLGSVVMGIQRVALATVRYAGLPDEVWQNLAQPIIARWKVTLDVVRSTAFRNFPVEA